MEKKRCTKQKNYSVNILPEKNIIHNYEQFPNEAFFTKINYFNIFSNKSLLQINGIKITNLKKLIENHSSIIKEINNFYYIPKSERSGSPKGSGSSKKTGLPKGSGSSESPDGSPHELNEIKNIKANLTANKKYFEDALIYKIKIQYTQNKQVEKIVREIMISISGQLRELIVNPVDWGKLNWYQKFKRIKKVINENEFVQIPDNVRLLVT